MKIELLGTRDRHGNNMYRLLEDYTHHDGTVVRAGFVTNFGTIPRGLKWVVRPAEMREAAVVHDWRVGEFGQKSREMSRKGADCLLIEDLYANKMNKWKVIAIWYALRVYAYYTGKR